jgi:hypothetical protein
MKGTSFEKVRTLLTNLYTHGKCTLTTTNIYIDNRCAWREIKTIPKHGKKGSVTKMIRRRTINDVTMIFRGYGPSTTMNMPSKLKILEQLKRQSPLKPSKIENTWHMRKNKKSYFFQLYSNVYSETWWGLFSEILF